MMQAALLWLGLVVPGPLGSPAAESAFARVLARAERALDQGDLEGARVALLRALERDPKSLAAWELRIRWARETNDQDELIYALHKHAWLALTLEHDRREVESLRERLYAADPTAVDLEAMRTTFVERLLPVAEAYEEEGRRHSAIRVHRQILALDPSRTASEEAVQRLANAPDPSLAADAKQVDILAGVSEEWIREHDEETRDWGDRAKLKTENYRTQTNAGYEILVRCSQAMEQMNAFYRKFFRYGTKEDGGSVSRIDLNIYADPEEYRKKTGAPEWSGGVFTGSSVETFLTDSGFEGTVSTLFHEAAHQFVDMSTSASGWLNEGIASFFEGTRILANGTVQMNLPATHRLIPLARRLRNGWMADANDGIDNGNPNQVPERAPTLEILIQASYQWGPAWYAPAWGFVFFFYNFQDPVDGRYIYRDALWDYVQSPGGVSAFEDRVLGNPAEPTKRVAVAYREDDLPKTAAEASELWKEWLIELNDVQLGRAQAERPWLEWAGYARQREAFEHATEMYEKGLQDDPRDPDLLLAFADHLAEDLENFDRAAKLAKRALRLLEAQPEVDEKLVKRIDKRLKDWDPERETIDEIQQELWATAQGIVRRYHSSGLNLMTMELAWRLGVELEVPGMFEVYEQAYRESQESIQLWKLAYNEEDLRGWAGSGAGYFHVDGPRIESRFDDNQQEYDYRFLTLDTITSGDFSFECEISALPGKVAFCGITFGRKTDKNFHGALLFPEKEASGGTSGSGFIDVASFFGDTDNRTWRHVPTSGLRAADDAQPSTATRWDRLRVDITGSLVDVWFNGRYVATQDFGTSDALRGTFGLVTGPGEASWRNVRYLARPAFDPGAAIARAVKLEDVVDEGGSIGGSWLGKRAPFPMISKWVRGERKSWDEAPDAPHLLALFSIAQNDIVPIDEWLAHVAEEYADAGLEILCVASPLDADAIDGYLADHPFPGLVGVDTFQPEGGIGITFENYAVGTFNLPRLILFDVDGTVAWEGDPGFTSTAGWDRSVGSFLDDPLAELVSKRRLREMHAWLSGWREEGLPALQRGDLETAFPYLVGSSEFDPRLFEAVRAARAKYQAFEAAVAAPAVFASTLEREAAEPAMEMLVEYSGLLPNPIDGRRDKTAKSMRKHEHSKDWEKALDALKPCRKALQRKRELPLDELLEELAGLAGRFPRELAEDLEAARDAGDDERLAELIETAAERPQRWLVEAYFGW